MKTLMKILFITLLFLPFTLSAQWTDSGTRIRTNDNVNIGASTDAHALYVRTNKTGWQSGFVNQQGGVGAKIYIGHSAGHGMHIRGGTTGGQYTLQLYNANVQTNVFYNNGKVGLGLAGNVGIGTAAPAEKLHVNGSVRGNQSGALRISTGHGYMDIGPKNASYAHFYTDRPRFYFNKEVRVNTGMIGTHDANLQLRTHGTTHMTILKSNGNVGIGTASPADKLDVNGTVRAKAITVVSPHGNSFFPDASGWSYLSGVGIIFRNGNTEKMRINSDGNVGIGTTSPNNKLDVNGTIRAKEIKVESGWSDYVFYDDYKLPTLEEEEKHIEENGHLLGFESEQEMEGMIHLGDVSRRQQAKIEEIMLHLIELKKENEELKKLLKTDEK